MCTGLFCLSTYWILLLCINWGTLHNLYPRNLSPCQIALCSLMYQLILFSCFWRNHVYGMFERDKHFSHLSGLERELSFRTEMVWAAICLHHRITCTKIQLHLLYFYIVKECCFLFLHPYINKVWLTTLTLSQLHTVTQFCQLTNIFHQQIYIWRNVLFY